MSQGHHSVLPASTGDGLEYANGTCLDALVALRLTVQLASYLPASTSAALVRTIGQQDSK